MRGRAPDRARRGGLPPLAPIEQDPAGAVGEPADPAGAVGAGGGGGGGADLPPAQRATAVVLTIVSTNSRSGYVVHKLLQIIIIMMH